MSIGLIVAGIALAAFLSYQKIEIKRERWKTTQANMAVVQAAIHEFISKNRRLPCPALASLSYGSDSYGKETDCNDSSPLAGIIDTNEGTKETVRIGLVPVRTLGIALPYANDGWNGSLVYAVTKILATDSGWARGDPYTNGGIDVLDSEGNPAIDPPALYILLSNGPNGAGRFQPSGTFAMDCLPKSLETENCNGDALFRQAQYSEANGPLYFDDTLVHDRNVTYTGDSTLVSTLEKLLACQRDGAFFDPDDKFADSNGCIAGNFIGGSCPPGQVLEGVGISGGIRCVPNMKPGVCESGQVLIGYDLNGNLVCSDLTLKIQACAQSGRLYAGASHPQADEQGCLPPAR